MGVFSWVLEQRGWGLVPDQAGSVVFLEKGYKISNIIEVS